MQSLELFLSAYLKFFFVLTPFFVLSIFLAMTVSFSPEAKQRVALKAAMAILVMTFLLLLFGRYIFSVLGITLDAFRVGAGLLLFLSAVGLVNGTTAREPSREDQEIAIVPLAIPGTVGPATIGVLLLTGANLNGVSEYVLVSVALLLAVATVGLLLLAAGRIERRLGQTGLAILSKLTGLVLASIAAQMAFTGAKGLLR